MPLGSIVIQHNPVVSNPPGGEFNLSLQRTGITRLDFSSYRQVIKDMGGFYSCMFDILAPQRITDEFLDNGLGREVRCYNHYGALGWEGIITSMRQTMSISQRLESLERAANKTKVRYSVKQISDQLSTFVENTDMQNKYGILELVDSLDDPVSDASRADSRAEILVKDTSDPHRMKELRDRGDIKIPDGMSKLAVFCSGYYWYLTRRLYNKTTAGDANANTVISSIITDTGQFVASSDVATNTQQVTQNYKNDDLAWNVIVGVSETGDTADDRYISGMYENRKFVYEKRVAATLPNIKFWKDERNNIVDQSHRPLAGMLVRPNIFMRNTAVGNRPGKVYADVWDDPQVAYISEISYAERGQRVQFTAEEAISPLTSTVVNLAGRTKGKFFRKWIWKNMSEEEREWWTKREEERRNA